MYQVEGCIFYIGVGRGGGAAGEGGGGQGGTPPII